jgi:hypothetical protein
VPLIFANTPAINVAGTTHTDTHNTRDKKQETAQHPPVSAKLQKNGYVSHFIQAELWHFFRR